MQEDNVGEVWRTAPDLSAALAAAACVALDGLAARVLDQFHAVGIRAILLKGPVLARWLYDDPDERPYSDIDLLVSPADRPGAERVLTALGYAPVAIDVLPHDRPHHARTWVRHGGVMVDLHHTLIGAVAPSELVWTTLAADTEHLSVDGRELEVLSAPARGVLVVLHAAQHGVEAEGPLEDLRRAVARLSLAEWRRAAEIARTLDAVPAFFAGLALVPAGRELAGRLGVVERQTVETLLRSSGAPDTALGFDWLLHVRGPRAKATFLARKLVPQPAFMRAWSPLARRGRLGLAAAYAWRVVWLIARAGPGFLAWRRAKHRAGR